MEQDEVMAQADAKNYFSHRTLPLTSSTSGTVAELADGVGYFTNQIVNVCFINADDGGYVLIDAGMPASADEILEAAKAYTGKSGPPSAIILTHGHFDHVGSLADILDRFAVPVYAHEEELPYLRGEADYPQGNADAGGGMITLLSPLYPNHGIQLGEKVTALPTDGTVPRLAGWRWIHTPGHTPGHMSLFRERDRALLAGDAFTTVRQESLFHVLWQDEEVNGPPAYFTPDVDAAWRSIQKLADLSPEVAVTGHGRAMYGEALFQGLKRLRNSRNLR